MQRRNYLKGLIGSGSIITVSRTGQAQEHDLDQWKEAEEDKEDEEDEEDEGDEDEDESEENDSVMGLTVDPIQPVRVGIIGLGNRGTSVTNHIDAMYPDKGVINAICDIRKGRVDAVRSNLQNGQDPDTYSGSENSWKGLVERDDLDLVFVFTPHQKHTPMATYAMEQGKHVAVEVPAATSIEECWELVDTAERTQRNCMMMENVNYFDTEMWVLNMVRNGVFGDKLTYAAGGYIHNLAGGYFLNAYWNDWRARNHRQFKGDLYPTHGLGPIAWYMDIQRGNRFEYLTSTESPETALTELASDLDKSHWAHGVEDWANGDNTKSLIKTSRGQSIELEFDVKTNRGYSRRNELSGTDAFHTGFPSNLAVDSEGHGFVDNDTYGSYRDEHRHPLWDVMGDLAEEHGGHGGGDFLMIYRLFDALNNGRPLDMDVYDAAAWSAVRPLSAISIENDGKPVQFPDFTRGDWNQDRDLPIMNFDTIDGPPDPKPPTKDTWASDMEWVSASTGYGKIGRDEGVADQPLIINGTEYDKGIGTHAHSEIKFHLGGNCDRFTAEIGLDEHPTDPGSVVFKIDADGEEIYSSDTLQPNSKVVNVDVSVAGAKYVTLKATTAGDDNFGDHADWANAKFHCNSAD